MPHIVKRGPADDDLGEVTVIETNEAAETVNRYKFTVTAKNRSNFRRVKDDRAQKYGGGAEETDNGGICAGETLVLQTHFAIVHGRQAQVGPDEVPETVAEALRDAGAEEVRA